MSRLDKAVEKLNKAELEYEKALKEQAIQSFKDQLVKEIEDKYGKKGKLPWHKDYKNPKDER